LQENLDLEVHPNKVIMQEIAQWINFVGAILKPYHRYIRNRTFINFEKILLNLKNLVNNKITLNKEQKEHFLASLNSYLWFLKQTSSKKRFLLIYNKYSSSISKYFTLSNRCFILRE
jgi:hypothetical protein